ncbi:PIN domain-containing protein [Luteolibacter arcticus]|uniref:Ribonuclease VapC n=1 Tax=Luteolibacter arcticus TaxID=1581411 RepID=A0ABT3GN68_9BACT|nr:PIN domain-containing protein [Luteolibacter arcticus]MCW1924939.1 PIN domain-containing protein [Luteolibacter arcticus]
MLSIDTNLLFFGYAADRPEHETARDWLESLVSRKDVVLSEFILVEFYNLLRNPAVLKRPLGAGEATEMIQIYRSHPYWKIVGFPRDSRRMHDELWTLAATPGLPRRRIFDARQAYALLHHGVRSFATANVKDFEGLGFERVWNPLLKKA